MFLSLDICCLFVLMGDYCKTKYREICDKSQICIYIYTNIKLF